MKINKINLTTDKINLTTNITTTKTILLNQIKALSED